MIASGEAPVFPAGAAVRVGALPWRRRAGWDTELERDGLFPLGTWEGEYPTGVEKLVFLQNRQNPT